MKKLTFMLVVLALIVSNLACRTLLPESTQGQYESVCREAVSGVAALKINLQLPKHFQAEHPKKQGGEFDPNLYFDVLTLLKMQAGFTLDYVYEQSGFAGSPLLYAHKLDQTPLLTDTDFFAAQPPNYLSAVKVDDSPEGYLQFITLAVMAPQFYLDWHANYNDKQILCGSSDIERVISEHKDNDFRYPMSAAQALKARAISHPDPSIDLQADRAVVSVLIFTDWGGFLRRTYTISRSFPHEIIDVKDETLVEYDCGIMF